MDSCEYESSRKGLSNFKCSMPKMSCFIPNKVIFFRDVATFICNRRYTTFQNVEGSFGSEGRGNPISLRKHGNKRSEREDKKTEANDVKATFSWHSLCTHVVNTIYLSISHFKPSCFSNVDYVVLMLTTLHLHMKSMRVCIKTRSPPASLPLKGQVTRHTTVKWTIGVYGPVLELGYE